MNIKPAQNMIFNRFILAILLFTIITIGCKKDIEIDLSQIDNVVGSYSGRFTEELCSGQFNPKITKFNNSTLLINYWSSGPDSIKMEIDGNALEIKAQIFNLEEHSLGQGHLYYYELRLSASGSFLNDQIQMTYKEEIRIEWENDFNHMTSGTLDLHKIER